MSTVSLRHKKHFQIHAAMFDPEIAKIHVQKINDSSTQDRSVYSSLLTGKIGGGTTHISVLAENGDAVAVSSSINDK